MSRLSEIYEGWKNLVFDNQEVKEEAERRMAICDACPNLTKHNYCKLCSCYMPAKVRSLESRCWDKKW